MPPPQFVVLGNNGFVNSMLLKAGLIGAPVQFMFTEFGVVTALVHVTLPVMVIMLAAALSHIDRDYERAAASLGAGPIRVFLTVTLPLSTRLMFLRSPTSVPFTKMVARASLSRSSLPEHAWPGLRPRDLGAGTVPSPSGMMRRVIQQQGAVVLEASCGP